MKTKVIKIVNLIFAVLVAFFVTGYALAWFAGDMASKTPGFGGSSAGAYFASGSGSSTDPFIINDKIHLYNLAWLQNTGRLVDANGNPEKYYFEISDNVSEVDMSGIVLPPIGNDDNPFIGEFNGKGKTISNLVISTNKEVLTNSPLQSSDPYQFSNAVGMFGMTGAGSNVKNFLLKEPTVEVATKNTAYADSASSSATVGLAIGYANGNASDISVFGGNLSVKKLGYTTLNSIVGGVAGNVSTDIGGSSGGSGANFGASFDVSGMYARLEKIEANKASATPAWRLPNLGTSSSSSITLGSLEKMPFAVSDASTYVGEDAAEVVSTNNIGYLLGNQNKVYSKNLTFGDLLDEDETGNWKYSDGTNPSSKVFPRWIYWTTATEISTDVYSSANGFAPLSSEEFAELPEGIRNLVPVSSGLFENYVSIRLSQTYNNAGIQIYSGTTSNGQWSPHGQISWMGKTYGEGYTMTDYSGAAVDENGIRYTADGNMIDENGYMYNNEGYFVGNGVWPVMSGGIDDDGYVLDNNGARCLDDEGEEIKYGGYGIGSDESGFYLIKPNGSILVYKDAWGGTNRLTPQTGTEVEFYRYENGIALPNCGIWFKPAIAGTIRFVMYAESSGDGFALLKGQRTNATKENPFLVDYSKYGSDVTVTEVGKYKLPAYVLFYFEFEVSEEDIAAGNVEYWLMQYGNGGAYFVYLDMGASGEEGGGSGTTTEYEVKNIDFVYKDSTTAIVLVTDSSFTKTYVVVDFTTETITYLYFSRPDNGTDGTYTIEAAYNGTKPTATASSGGGANLTETTDVIVVTYSGASVS